MSENPEGTRLVTITRHARMQTRKRFPELAEQTGDLVAHLYYEIQTAMAEGRMSKRIPHGFTYDSRRSRNRSPQKLRYCWNEERSRCFILVHSHEDRSNKGNKRTWVVVTVIGPRTPA